MSLRRFLNVAYIILMEEYQRIGFDLVTALDKVAEWRERSDLEKDVSDVPVDARQNEQAMSLLKARLSGVQGAPTK